MGAALAVELGRFDPVNFVLVLVGGVLIQVGTNMVNDAYDVRFGVDTRERARRGHAVFDGRLEPSRELLVGLWVFGAALLLGVILAFRVGALLLVPVGLGILGGYFYTAPPVRYKYRGLGVPAVFLLMGPLMVWAAAFGTSGEMPLSLWWVSVPVGFLVAAILHANDLRDAPGDRAGGVATLAGAVGPSWALGAYATLLFVPYAVALLAVVAGGLPATALLAVATFPLALNAYRMARRSVLGAIDAQTAQVHLAFGVLLAVGIALSGTVL